MSAASLVIGICGLVIACLSLGWQAANFALTGGRVRVKLQVGAIGGGAMITGNPGKLNPQWLHQLAEQGYPQPIVAIEVANVGRQPVTVKRWSLTCGPISMNPGLRKIGTAVSGSDDLG